MANPTSAINVQIDSETKKQATEILNDLGISMSTAINMFLRQVIKNEGLPFPVVKRKPSKQLLEALKEAAEMEKHPEKYKSYNNIDQLFEDLSK